ncbi:raffinose/stachyose/melibiose transport system substrate-binding protein [Paenibacillus phyllosphaerae]|uniref:Raffinose/stachyose/melibiose transport system substrate-binding protein n=1 Tax=Paenibacillus phyllosphaerae TaxID=274593 RepID=A0A7W5B0J1_9BACL|nr:extracellular solute-binding protein [Paenibacillus phyllosphaerae]MBB3111456.1 raffinose/stachyose/melibiose transport system substrate-binding protein [Paenibacillus phyllosphaerae]
MKKSVSTMLMVILLTILAACGNNGGNGANEGAASSAEAANTATESETTAAPEATSEEAVRLTIGSWRTEDKAAYDKIAAQFHEQNPTITVEFAPTKNTEYNTVLNTQLMTGEGPDIIHLRPYVAGKQVADSNFLVPLDGTPGLEQIPSELLIAATGSDGKVYGAPILKNASLILYNKQLFDKLGLTEPKTWDELIQTAEALKSNKIVPFAFGSKEGWILSLTHGAIGPVAYGGNDFVKQITTGQTNFTSQAFTDSVQLLKDLEPYYPDNYEGIGMDDMRNLFVTEQAGMMIMGDWEIAVMRKMNPDLQIDAFPVPTKDGQASVSTWVDGSFAINVNSKHQEAAKKFIAFALTESFGTTLSNELVRQSTIPSVQSGDELIKKIASFSNDAAIATPYMFNVYFAAGNPSSKTAFETSVQGYLLGKLKVEDVGAEVQKSVDTWFKPLSQ